jgi:uncharacterized metal-binding protein
MKDDPCSGCATCRTAASFRGDVTKMPPTCPTLTRSEITKDASPYLDDALHSLMMAADDTPKTADGRLRNRVEELIHFANGRGMKRIGIAFCVTLLREAQQLGRMLKEAGFEPRPVCCRVGAIDYAEIGLPKAHPERFAAICNPVAQARLLNDDKVDLVVQVGLCIGHDLVLQDVCDAPVTTLVVKDRVYDHHAIKALRCSVPDDADGG